MPALKIFTPSELDLARTMRADNKSWRSVASALGCAEDTIRCALDADFMRRRHEGIVARRRERNAAIKAAREAKEARSATAYQPSSIGFQ